MMIEGEGENCSLPYSNAGGTSRSSDQGWPKKELFFCTRLAVRAACQEDLLLNLSILSLMCAYAPHAQA